MGFRVAQSYNGGQCEGLEPWERVTRFPRFSFYGNRAGESAKRKRKKMPDIHFGHLIKKELKRQRRSVAWFAKEMSYTRGNMYKILERSHLNSDFLLRATEKLQHDFFHDVSEILQTDNYYSGEN